MSVLKVLGEGKGGRGWTYFPANTTKNGGMINFRGIMGGGLYMHTCVTCFQLMNLLVLHGMRAYYETPSVNSHLIALQMVSLSCLQPLRLRCVKPERSSGGAGKGE